MDDQEFWQELRRRLGNEEEVRPDPVQEQIDTLVRLSLGNDEMHGVMVERILDLEKHCKVLERKIDTFEQTVRSLQATVTDHVAPLLSEVWGARHELGWYRQVAQNRPVVKDAEGRTWVQEGGPRYPGPALPPGDPPAET